MSNTGNQSKTVNVPMYIEPGLDVREYGLDPSDIRILTFGTRKVKVIFIPTEPEKAPLLWQIFNGRVNEDKKDIRNSRCMIPGKHGPVRCPESNKCYECEYGNSLSHHTSSTLSLDAYLEDGGPEPAYETSPQEERMYELLIDDLIDYLADIRPEYGKVFRLLYDGVSLRREIAEDLDIPLSTAKEWVSKVRKLAEDYYNKNLK